jgi:hypothetical protein
MVVNDFHIFGSGGCPSKAKPKLIVDANAALPCTITDQRLEPISGRHAKIL